MTQTFGQIVAVKLARAEGSASREIDLEIVARLSALQEPRVLDYFWLMFRRGAEPLGLLLQLGRVVIERPATWDRAAIRRAHESGTGAFGPRLSRTQCFACMVRGRLYFHHVIEVQNGGSNDLRNKLPLCFACHQYLHPWLTEEPIGADVGARGFESLGAVLARSKPIVMTDMVKL